ncbi:hypothetical protein QBC35DRAFT_467454 [Podospora australis]|uniref:Ankyrin repeat protein n=1 Tax=Podospora australis TaxID=1536484 RepID=A0AAN6WKX3_9PEZI|nr:hypothetical protein QBC35DRAFT_467454 [Podospora australis]
MTVLPLCKQLFDTSIRRPHEIFTNPSFETIYDVYLSGGELISADELEDNGRYIDWLLFGITGMDGSGRVGRVTEVECPLLHLACARGCDETASFFIDHGVGFREDSYAFCDCFTLEQEIELAGPNSQGTFRGVPPLWRPLHHAICRVVTFSSIAKIRLLLTFNNDLDVNHSDHDGKTALMIAAPNCNREIVDLLLESGADVNLPDRFGHTAAWHLFNNPSFLEDRGTGFVLQLLMEHGGNIGYMSDDQRVMGRVDQRDSLQSTVLSVVIGIASTHINPENSFTGTEPEGRSWSPYNAYEREDTIFSEVVFIVHLATGANISEAIWEAARMQAVCAPMTKPQNTFGFYSALSRRLDLMAQAISNLRLFTANNTRGLPARSGYVTREAILVMAVANGVSDPSVYSALFATPQEQIATSRDDSGRATTVTTIRPAARGGKTQSVATPSEHPLPKVIADEIAGYGRGFASWLKEQRLSGLSAFEMANMLGRFDVVREFLRHKPLPEGHPAYLATSSTQYRWAVLTHKDRDAAYSPLLQVAAAAAASQDDSGNENEDGSADKTNSDSKTTSASMGDSEILSDSGISSDGSEIFSADSDYMTDGESPKESTKKKPRPDAAKRNYTFAILEWGLCVAVMSEQLALLSRLDQVPRASMGAFMDLLSRIYAGPDGVLKTTLQQAFPFEKQEDGSSILPGDYGIGGIPVLPPAGMRTLHLSAGLLPVSTLFC